MSLDIRDSLTWCQGVGVRNYPGIQFLQEKFRISQIRRSMHQPLLLPDSVGKNAPIDEEQYQQHPVPRLLELPNAKEANCMSEEDYDYDNMAYDEETGTHFPRLRRETSPYDDDLNAIAERIEFVEKHIQERIPLSQSESLAWKSLQEAEGILSDQMSLLEYNRGPLETSDFRPLVKSLKIYLDAKGSWRFAHLVSLLSPSTPEDRSSH